LSRFEFVLLLIFAQIFTRITCLALPKDFGGKDASDKRPKMTPGRGWVPQVPSTLPFATLIIYCQLVYLLLNHSEDHR